MSEPKVCYFDPGHSNGNAPKHKRYVLFTVRSVVSHELCTQRFTIHHSLFIHVQWHDDMTSTDLVAPSCCCCSHCESSRSRHGPPCPAMCGGLDELPAPEPPAGMLLRMLVTAPGTVLGAAGGRNTPPYAGASRPPLGACRTRDVRCAVSWPLQPATATVPACQQVIQLTAKQAPILLPKCTLTYNVYIPGPQAAPA